jgi:hypothetical protein
LDSYYYYAWVPPIARQWKCVNNFIVRISYMDNDRLNKKVHKHLNTISNYRCRNRNFRIKTQLRKINCDEFVNHIDIGIDKKALNDKVHTYLMNNFKLTWLENINKDVSNNGRGGNKLRKYKFL